MPFLGPPVAASHRDHAPYLRKVGLAEFLIRYPT